MTGFRTFGPAEIRDAVGLAELIQPVGRALAEFSQGRGETPIVVFAPAGQDGDVHVKSAWLPGMPVFTVKVAAWFAARAAAGRPAHSGFIAVLDAATGDLRALLRDDHHLTDLRTAAAGAVAARLLARSDARTVGVLGTGTGLPSGAGGARGTADRHRADLGPEPGCGPSAGRPAAGDVGCCRG